MKQTVIFCTIILIASCADPNRPYSPDMKHKTPVVELTADLDMYHSPSYETYSSNVNFSDNMTARKPVDGTVPRGYMPYLYPNTNEGYKAAGDSLKNPFLLTPEVLAEGKDLYLKFCGHCHGTEGNGDGSLVQNEKFPPPPSFSTGFSSGGGELRDLPEGKIFHSITYGRNLMGPHASQLNQQERWEIVHYVQALQKLGDKGESAEAAAGNPDNE